MKLQEKNKKKKFKINENITDSKTQSTTLVRYDRQEKLSREKKGL